MNRLSLIERLTTRTRAILVPPFDTGYSMLLEGPPGVGKTFVARQLSQVASDAGAAVLTARAEPGRRRESFGAISDLFGQAEADADPAEFAIEAADSLCADRPVMVWVDDAQYLDAASHGVLRRLVWAARNLPLVVLATCRSLPFREPLEALAEQVVERSHLLGMDGSEMDQLVFDRLGRWPTVALKGTLDAAAGNPLFAHELLTGLEHAHRLVSRAGNRVGIVASDSEVVPLALDIAIRGHLDQLDDAALDVACTVAVFAAPTHREHLAAAMYHERPAIDTAIATAVRAGVLHEPQADVVDVIHDVFREVLTDLMPPAHRRTTHRRIADLLRASGASDAVVADHLVHAGPTAEPSDDREPAVTVLSRAADLAGPFAPAVAAELLQDIERLETADSDAERNVLILRRVKALQASGQYGAAERLADEQLRITRDPAVAAELTSLLIRSLILRGDTRRGLREIEGTLAVPGLPGSVERQLQQLRVFVLVFDGQRILADQEISSLEPSFAQADDRDALAGLTVSAALTAYLDGRPGDAGAWMARYEELARHDGGMLMSALVWPPMFTLLTSGPTAAAQASVEARRLTADRDARWLLPFHCFVAAGAAFLSGDWDDAVAELDAGLELAAESGSGWISIPVGHRAYIHAHRGEVAAARHLLDEFRQRGLPLQFGTNEPGLADLALLEAHEATEAAALLARELWSAAPAKGSTWILQIAIDVTRCALAGAERELAGSIAEHLGGISTRQIPYFDCVLPLVTGMTRADTGLLESAAQIGAARGYVQAVGYAWEELACTAAAHGDWTRARDALDRAMAEYARRGATMDIDRLLARTRRLGLRRGTRQPRRPRNRGLESLTATELRVADLIGEGFTNPEIARRLYVSPRTIQTHVSRILAKLNLRSRVEVATAIIQPRR